MWSPDRRRLLGAGLAAALLAGCGFRPALREGGAVLALRDATALILPRGRLGFALREPLTRRLGRPGEDAVWTLTADLALDESGLAITPDSATTRYVVRGESRWRLEGPEGTPPLEGVEESMSAYSATGSLYATRTARRDAEARVAADLGQRILTALTAAMEARRDGAPGSGG